jgi:hypothetical protein
MHAAPTVATVLPHSPEAEAHLLSCIFLDGADVIARCHDAGIVAISFYEPRHNLLFACVAEMHRRELPVEVFTVAEELTRSNQIDAVGGVDYLVKLSKEIPTTAQANYFIEQVRDLHRRRRLIEQGHRLIEDASRPDATAAEVIADLRAKLERIDAAGVGIGSGTTAAALCGNPPPVPPELISSVLYEGGTMMLSGPSKSRKTYTFLDLALSVATGSDWLGFPTAKTAVLYLNFELSEHSFQRRLAAICTSKRIPPPANLRTFNLRGRTATMGMLADDLPRLIRNHGAGLVILDPWYKISAQSGVEENSNDGQARILAEAERIVTANGAALVVGHHFAKGDAGSKNSIDRAAGAGAMARWGDAIATLSEHEESDAMTLEMHLRDFAPVAPIALRWDQPLWRRDASLDPANLKRAGRSDAHPASELQNKLTGRMTGTEWRSAAGWSDSTFRRKRDELVTTGKVICEMSTYRRA